jgi:L-fuconolactonase
MNRRELLALITSAPLVAAGKNVRSIDTHTHFYDPSRSGGVPWPGPGETRLYRTVLPREFEALATPFGIAGTVVVEASPLVEDNQWILDLAKDNPIIKGFVGHLEPADREFAANLARFSRNPLFRGIRLGGSALPSVADGLKALADAGLTLDVIGGPAMLASVADVASKLPSLKIVIDHLPFEPFTAKADAALYQDGLKLLAPLPNVYAKVSGVLRQDVGQSGATLRIDKIWRTFGEDRILYASNWPVSDLAAPYADIHAIVNAYFWAKGRRVMDKFFWSNAIKAYGLSGV